jgi:hypothetical protein
MQELLSGLVRNVELSTLDVLKHESVLSHTMHQTSEIEAIWSNRSDGTFIFSEPKAGLMNAKSREWWKQAIAGQLFISPEYVYLLSRKSLALHFQKQYWMEEANQLV